jgi:hypothetical protein
VIPFSDGPVPQKAIWQSVERMSCINSLVSTCLSDDLPLLFSDSAAWKLQRLTMNVCQ